MRNYFILQNSSFLLYKFGVCRKFHICLGKKAWILGVYAQLPAKLWNNKSRECQKIEKKAEICSCIKNRRIGLSLNSCQRQQEVLIRALK